MRKWSNIHLTHFWGKKAGSHIDSSVFDMILPQCMVLLYEHYSHYFRVRFHKSYGSVIISLLVQIHFRTGWLLSYPPHELHDSQAEQAESCSKGGRRESRSWGQGGRIVHIMKVTQGHLGGNGAAEHWSWDVALCVCVCGGGGGGGCVSQCVDGVEGWVCKNLWCLHWKTTALVLPSFQVHSVPLQMFQLL